MSASRCGILALQGAIAPHIKILTALGLQHLEVRNAQDLSQVDRLIIPGGESSTMLRLLKHSGLTETLKAFTKEHPVWGICAGAIILAKEVAQPAQESLAAIQIRATRNFYGSQLNSFQAQIDLPTLDITTNVDFIRAPLLEPLAESVEILASYNNQAVLLKEGKVLVSSFHVELGNEVRLHKYFCEL